LTTRGVNDVMDDDDELVEKDVPTVGERLRSAREA
jgi:hypothetical protein